MALLAVHAGSHHELAHRTAGRSPAEAAGCSLAGIAVADRHFAAGSRLDRTVAHHIGLEARSPAEERRIAGCCTDCIDRKVQTSCLDCV